MPELKRPLKVFLSYASQDKPLVRELSRRLVGEGWIDTWQDEKNLLPGQDWRVKIEEAVEEADVVIIVLSQNSVSKEGHVQKELRYAREIALEKPEDTIFLIPLRLDECDVPRGLRFYQWVDYFGDNKDSSYKALVASLNLRYKQKIKAEETESLRKELQEREFTEKIAREKVEREAANKLDREKAEKEAAQKARLEVEELARQEVVKEKAEYERKEIEAREKQVREAIERAKQVDEKREKIVSKKEEDKPAVVKSKASSRSAYWVGGIALLVMGIVLFSSLNNPSQPPELTPTNAQPQEIFTSTTEAIEPSVTSTPKPSSTPASTVIPAPLPTEITDAKGVKMEFVSYNGVDGFYMDKYEVTNELYKICVTSGTCSLPTSSIYFNQEAYSNHPVVYVNHSMAQSYCEWREARLPTGDEWTLASRDENYVFFPWGDTHDCKYANVAYGIANGQYCVGATTPVGSYELGKSVFNIYDLIGNVAEWEQNGLSDYVFTYGGSWNSYQISEDWLAASANPNSNRVGFRCVATP